MRPLKDSLFSLFSLSAFFLLLGFIAAFKILMFTYELWTMDEKNCKLCFRIGTIMVWCNDFMRNNLRVRKKRYTLGRPYTTSAIGRGRGQKLVKITADMGEVCVNNLENCRRRLWMVPNTHNYFQMLLPKGKPTQDAGALKCNFL